MEAAADTEGGLAIRNAASLSDFITVCRWDGCDIRLTSRGGRNHSVFSE